MKEVALFTRAWIEMVISQYFILKILSPSSRGRGLKYKTITQFSHGFDVALFTRAWIEMARPLITKSLKKVALFTRAWIEIYEKVIKNQVLSVALFTRAWIEIKYTP